MTAIEYWAVEAQEIARRHANEFRQVTVQLFRDIANGGGSASLVLVVAQLIASQRAPVRIRHEAPNKGKQEVLVTEEFMQTRVRVV